MSLRAILNMPTHNKSQSLRKVTGDIFPDVALPLCNFCDVCVCGIRLPVASGYRWAYICAFLVSYAIYEDPHAHLQLNIAGESFYPIDSCFHA